MSHAIPLSHEGRTVRVDGRDVAAWAGIRGVDHVEGEEWAERAAAYVAAHPRPSGAAGSTGVAAAQRLALLRRLAAGPARRAELLALMRAAAGWVGANDLDNRLRELRRGDRRAPGAGLALRVDGEQVCLAEPFPLLDASAARALAFAKAVLSRLAGPLAHGAVAALEGLLPGLSPEGSGPLSSTFRASAKSLDHFEEARIRGRPVRVRYFSMNSGLERTYELVPVRYVPVSPVVKALCVPVNADGERVDDDRQFALDRLLWAEPLPAWRSPAPATLRLRLAPIVMDVSEGLYGVLRERDLFGISETEARQVDVDVWRVGGTFPVALAWDVMEQLCAWAGNVLVHEPLWLVNAVARRLRAGLAVTETAAEFELVKPEPQRVFASHGEAVAEDAAPELDRGAGRARRLPPPRSAEA